MSAASSPNPAASNGQLSTSQPLRSALKCDDDGDRASPASGSLKAVHIADTDPEVQLLEDDSQPMRQFPAGPKRRLSGKLPPPQLNGSSRSVSESPLPARSHEDKDNAHSSHHQSHHRQYYSEKLLAQVNDWLEHEKRKASSRKRKPRGQKSKSPPKGSDQDLDRKTRHDQESNGHVRSESVDSQGSDVSFDRLQRILEDSMAHMGFNSVPNFTPRVSRPRNRKSSSRNSLRGAASSDTDYVDGDVIVPSCDAWLDNSKTMSYGGGAAGAEESAVSESKADQEREAWTNFKNEIIRITHTLRLKGWRRIPLGAGDTISVQRLSGALTNAVYVVSPPADLPEVVGKKPPAKILLRVYGPQVEHLIDRENELSVLQRLARNKIGPRLLGTFQNGRFEQFFNAITLTPSDLRDPYLSRQIAKRMRELHDGIELLPHERQNGPTAWRNWDQWLENVERITSFLDKQFENETQATKRTDSVLHAWKANGYVCGTPWAQFKDAVIKYREYVNGRYGGKKDINSRIVFTHSDTQYGNILRVKPDDEKSPLLQPANQHKQLIVIDFEYAGANMIGYEFANHFNEWTYNYHDPVFSWACNHKRYPLPDEQKRFVKAYVDHRPKIQSKPTTPQLVASDSNLSSGPSTPLAQPTNASSSSIVEFMLDARVPPGGWSANERANEEKSEQRVRELLEETRLWRPASHVVWITWGIVQAKIPGLDVSFTEDDVGPDEFNYLSYAQDRALYFWADLVQLGLVKKEELPEKVQAGLKFVEY